MLSRISSLQPKSWQGAGCILRALLWAGVKRYVDDNIDLIHEVKGVCGEGWQLVLFADVGGARSYMASEQDPYFGMLELLPPENQEKIRSLRNRLTSTEQIFSKPKAWLLRLQGNLLLPEGEIGWDAIAELLFWASRLDVSLPSVDTLFQEFEKKVEKLPLDTAADLLFAFSLSIGDNMSQVKSQDVV